MKNFKDFELTTTQQLNTIGKGKPAFAGGGKPDFAGNGKPEWAGKGKPEWAGKPDGVGKPENEEMTEEMGS
ncbi:MAG: hypothetical protein AB8G86_22225 [Saprospiraceae bacterium]